MLSHYEGIISHMQLRKETSTLLIEGCAFGVNLITDRTDTCGKQGWSNDLELTRKDLH